jgi:hypothetical protein
MPLVMFEFDDNSVSYIKDILIDSYRDCEVTIEGEKVEGIKLDDRLSPKDFYAFTAILIKEKTTWK